MDTQQQNIQEDTEKEIVESMKTPLEDIKTERQKQIELAGQMNFHRTAITEVKSRIGKECTYLSHLRTKGTIWFLAHLIIKGEKRIVRINSEKENPSELVAENYKALKLQLEDYVTGKKDL